MINVELEKNKHSCLIKAMGLSLMMEGIWKYTQIIQIEKMLQKLMMSY